MLDPQKFEAIIFDLGQVIIDLDVKGVLDGFAAHSPLENVAIKHAIVSSPALYAYETEQMSDTAFVEEMNSSMQTSIAFNEFEVIWNKMLGYLPKERLDFLQKLMKTHKVFFLSNTNAMHERFFDKMAEEHTGKKLSEFAHFPLYSHDLGYRKPDPAIYQYVLNNYGLSADKTLFIDDKPENTDAAQALGIATYNHLGKINIINIFG